MIECASVPRCSIQRGSGRLRFLKIKGKEDSRAEQESPFSPGAVRAYSGAARAFKWDQQEQKNVASTGPPAAFPRPVQRTRARGESSRATESPALPARLLHAHRKLQVHRTPGKSHSRRGAQIVARLLFRTGQNSPGDPQYCLGSTCLRASPAQA